MAKTDRKKNMASMLSKLVESEPVDSYMEFIYKNKGDIEVKNLKLYDLVEAPKEWNFFPPLSSMKMLEMIYSIRENGLFNPILTWEREGEYMILSGHNRVSAYRELMKEDEEKYSSIPSIIFSKDEIDEAKAKEIIIDTNYVQREDDKRILPMIVKNRMDIVKKRKDLKGRTIDIVADEMNIGRTTIYKINLIATRIIPELAELYFNGTLTKDAVTKFAWFNEGVQRKIYKQFKDKISNDTVLKLRKKMDFSQIKECFEEEDDTEYVHLLIRVPMSIKDDIRAMIDEMIKKTRS